MGAGASAEEAAAGAARAAMGGYSVLGMCALAARCIAQHIAQRISQHIAKCISALIRALLTIAQRIVSALLSIVS